MRARILLVLAVLAMPSAVAFGHEGGLPDAGLQDVNARALNVLEHHPFPDAQGDPWGFAYGDSDVDFMQASYQSVLFPTAVFDGVQRLEGATQFLETFNAYESMFLQRRAMDVPLRLGLSGGILEPMSLLEARVDWKSASQAETMVLRAALFEDDVKFAGGNKVDVHRFTVRRIATEVNLPAGVVGFNHTFAAPMAEDWDRSRVGWVVWVVNTAADDPVFAANEVLQSATYLHSQSGPTIQASRGVLLELYTATWCPTCLYGDGAVDALANQYGEPSSRFLDRAYEYWRPFGLGQLVAGAVVAGLAAVLAIRRERGDRAT